MIRVPTTNAVPFRTAYPPLDSIRGAIRKGKVSTGLRKCEARALNVKRLYEWP